MKNRQARPISRSSRKPCNPVAIIDQDDDAGGEILQIDSTSNRLTGRHALWSGNSTSTWQPSPLSSVAVDRYMATDDFEYAYFADGE